MDLKKKPRLTCRCVLASVDVKCKDENDRNFELFLLIFRYWMLHKSGARKTRVITVWLVWAGVMALNPGCAITTHATLYNSARSWCNESAQPTHLRQQQQFFQQHPNKCWRGQANRGHLATLMQNCLLLKTCAAETAWWSWCKKMLVPQLLGVNGLLASQAFGSCLT